MKLSLADEVRRVGNTARWSWEGWCAAWKTEKSIRQWTVINLISAVLAFALRLSPGQRGMILALGLLILAAELVNTAIEQVVNAISPGPSDHAKMAKDCGSAAVVVTALAGAVAWIVILIG